jgi:hypothetical protein
MFMATMIMQFRLEHRIFGDTLSTPKTPMKNATAFGDDTKKGISSQ